MADWSTIASLATASGTPFAILAFTVIGDRAVTIDIFNDRELVPRLVRAGADASGEDE